MVQDVQINPITTCARVDGIPNGAGIPMLPKLDTGTKPYSTVPLTTPLAGAKNDASVVLPGKEPETNTPLYSALYPTTTVFLITYENSSGPPDIWPDAPVLPSITSPSNMVLPRFREAKRGRPGWFVVIRGKVPGIYTDWLLVSSIVTGVSRNLYKKYATESDARMVWRAAWDAREIYRVLD